MRIVINLMLVTFFLFSGISQVPACYATKLDCAQKNTSSCPFTDIQIESSTTLVSCPLMAENRLDKKTKASVPLERYKRLKIEQIEYSPTKVPPFIPTFVASAVLETDYTLPVLLPVTNLIIHPHYHPPPLFIQFQSFLI